MNESPNGYRFESTIGKVNVLIPMKKQLPRSRVARSHCTPEYRVNYSLVLPRIKLKVDYEKQLKYEKEKYKRRVPLTKPFYYERAHIKPSLY